MAKRNEKKGKLVSPLYTGGGGEMAVSGPTGGKQQADPLGYLKRKKG